MTLSPHIRIGVIALGLSAMIDQAFKIWMIHGLDMAERGVIRLGPFMDLVMAWNPGISFGLLPQDSFAGQMVLLAIKISAVIAISWWLMQAETRLTALALGLIAGGAIGNGIDRALYGAVADFFFFHIRTETWVFNWYVFNLADVAIVAGVATLLYETVFGGASAAKSP